MQVYAMRLARQEITVGVILTRGIDIGHYCHRDEEGHNLCLYSEHPEV